MGKQHKRTLKTHKPTSIADAVEAERVRAALEKRRAGQHLSVTELAAIKRFERQRAAEQRRDAYQNVPQTELVPMLQTTRKVLLQWEGEGLPANRNSRPITYNLFEALPWLKRRWMLATEPGTPSKRSAEIDLLVARKVHLELKTRLASGDLVSREAVEEAIISRCLLTKHGLIALRRTLAPALLEIGPDATIEEVEKTIWEYTKALMDAWARPEIAVRDGERVTRIRINFPDGATNENEIKPQASGK